MQQNQKQTKKIKNVDVAEDSATQIKLKDKAWQQLQKILGVQTKIVKSQIIVNVPLYGKMVQQEK